MGNFISCAGTFDSKNMIALEQQKINQKIPLLCKARKNKLSLLYQIRMMNLMYILFVLGSLNIRAFWETGSYFLCVM